ncbi:EAL domain-containing protein [Agrobacterium sp. SHOUNA12C]|uniref:Signaling protein n=2 Tax=Rhizobium rhizogenes TaxID=359 RepID=A0AA87Q1T2_RHIRH|nr:EAL domain-containing protein [Rhizobium rhizogenes]MCJ9724236.1 EAL domain-containing protein [Agrobacterium sp. BETTINA12B]MCJ9759813.1 EAL domain-containing protein [Agrobacterium sp. SHOUNA12C]MDJ1638472.1 EAL domain-containing protein [Rhizobium rhizogenes]WEO63688.1 EAL domain-containing protein [Rhizobium rhizogenes]GAJ93945.1 putative signaling protein [Rhizobium rhizogenes NBRC 13257]
MQAFHVSAGGPNSVGEAISGRSELEFQNLLRRLELALETSQIGVWEHNLNGEEMLWDMQMHKLYQTGLRDRKVSSEVWLNALHPDDVAQAVADFDAAIAEKGFYNSQFRIFLPNGDVRYLRSRAHFFEGPDGAPSFIGAEWDVTADVLLNRELTEQKAVAEARAIALEQSRARIEHAADHDYLTGLPNRRYFDRRLAELCADQAVETLAILHIDLDGFKQINDKWGHAAGDATLQTAAARILGGIAAGDMVARVGGDEFVAVLVNIATSDEVGTIAEDILWRLRRDIRFGHEMLQVGASIGAAWSVADGAANLLAESDIALYQAKKLGRNRVEFFTPKLQSDLQGERRLAEELRLALMRNEIVPFYQIQVDACSRRIVGLEALARWRHPGKGLLPPAAFLKVAEEYGLTAEIDAAILNRALSDRAAWALQGLMPPRISVNISASRLADPGLVERLQMLNIPRHAIVFELIETIFLDDPDDRVLANVDAIKRMDIDIEIDDFGSGHASLIGLVKLKPKRLKIDRQLVTAITVSDEQRRLVGSIVEIARALNVEVMAEGVETEEHAQLLADAGCDGLQGYAFGYPSPASEIAALLASAQRPVAARSPVAAQGKGGVSGSAGRQSAHS